MTQSAVAELEAIATIDLPAGLVGMPQLQSCSLSRWGGDDSPFALLRGGGDSDVEFVVMPPSLFFPSYSPVVDDDVVDAIGLESADDAVVLVIVTVGDPVESSTANLLGPIVVNRHTHRAVQAVLSPELHSPRQPLVPA